MSVLSLTVSAVEPVEVEPAVSVTFTAKLVCTVEPPTPWWAVGV